MNLYIEMPCSTYYGGGAEAPCTCFALVWLTAVRRAHRKLVSIHYKIHPGSYIMQKNHDGESASTFSVPGCPRAAR